MPIQRSVVCGGGLVPRGCPGVIRLDPARSSALRGHQALLGRWRLPDLPEPFGVLGSLVVCTERGRNVPAGPQELSNATNSYEIGILCDHPTGLNPEESGVRI